jgi:hypothetical protein
MRYWPHSHEHTGNVGETWRYWVSGARRILRRSFLGVTSLTRNEFILLAGGPAGIRLPDALFGLRLVRGFYSVQGTIMLWGISIGSCGDSAARTEFNRWDLARILSRMYALAGQSERCLNLWRWA